MEPRDVPNSSGNLQEFDQSYDELEKEVNW